MIGKDRHHFSPGNVVAAFVKDQKSVANEIPQFRIPQIHRRLHKIAKVSIVDQVPEKDAKDKEKKVEKEAKEGKAKESKEAKAITGALTAKWNAVPRGDLDQFADFLQQTLADLEAPTTQKVIRTWFKQQAWEDVIWAILNAKEFQFVW